MLDTATHGKKTPTMTHPDISGLQYQRDLGSGGFADVYLYRRQAPNRLVAIKVLRATNMDHELVERFTAEADMMAALTHPHIAQIYSSGITSDQHPYIEMAYYPNGSLQDQISKQPLTVPDTLRIGVQLCSAVQTAHQLNPPLLHRDIKPANVLIDEYNDPALTDFGIASRLTEQDNDVSLSVYWAAPEIMFPDAPIDERSDIYSLGALLYHLLAGHAPFTIPGGDNRPDPTMDRTRDLPVPSLERPDVPTSLERLLALTMSKNPRFRPTSATDFARALQSIEQQQYGFAQVTPFKTRSTPTTQTKTPTADIAYERTKLKSNIQIDIQLASDISPAIKPPATTPDRDSELDEPESRAPMAQSPLTSAHVSRGSSEPPSEEPEVTYQDGQQVVGTHTSLKPSTITQDAPNTTDSQNKHLESSLKPTTNPANGDEPGHYWYTTPIESLPEESAILRVDNDPAIGQNAQMGTSTNLAPNSPEPPSEEPEVTYQDGLQVETHTPPSPSAITQDAPNTADSQNKHLESSLRPTAEPANGDEPGHYWYTTPQPGMVPSNNSEPLTPEISFHNHLTPNEDPTTTDTDQSTTTDAPATANTDTNKTTDHTAGLAIRILAVFLLGLIAAGVILHTLSQNQVSTDSHGIITLVRGTYTVGKKCIRVVM